MSCHPSLLLSALLLSGCGSDCNLLSGRATPCDAPMAAGALLLAPVAAPVLLLDGVGQDAADRRRFAEMQARVRAGEPAALRQCAIGCNSLSAGAVSAEQRHALRRQAAEALLAQAGPAPEDADVPALIVAYALTLNPRAPSALPQALALLRRPDVEALAGAGGTAPYGGFGFVVSQLYGMAVAVRLREASNRGAAWARCAEDAAAYAAPFRPTPLAICSQAWRWVEEGAPPEPLRRRWMRLTSLE
ncbi:hypothetical protein GXW71_33590 [Roseomonas hellenica]|uniref:Lipoprotein n=1 Tax=Plastoroseomonas hellenica TaxID=2687306 RepID=A0ABS5F9U3_9PROT|nr:hypothetical protein [Plastoroseomonas hellenica]MBR0669332.1 hypothetical protein [Plastoroseomonas hellenica]